MIPPCLTLRDIRYVSRIKWSNPRKEVAPSPTPRCSSYWKGILLIALDYSRQLYLLIKQGWIKYHFWVFGMTRPGTESQSSEPLANNTSKVILWLDVHCTFCIIVKVFFGGWGLDRVLSNVDIFKRMYLTHRWDPNRYYLFATELTWTW